MSETVSTTKSLKYLIGKTDLDGKGEGDRLIKAGMALAAFPDPPSGIAGASLVIAGLVKKKMKPTTVMNIHRNFYYVMKKFKDLTCKLNEAKLSSYGSVFNIGSY
jgi:hypothetical protein